MKPPAIPVAQIRELAPACFNMVIPQAWADINGHMNMRWYVAIFDDAGDHMYLRLGLTPELHREHGSGTFDLEHHTHFINETMPGDRVSVYTRMVSHSAKRIHYVMFLVNETKGNLSAIFECVNSFMDLRARKTAPYPPALAERLAIVVAEDNRLSWPAPVCGAMRA